MMRARFILLPVLLLTAACSSLDVKVAIADPSIGHAVLDQVRLRRDLPSLLAQTDIEVRALLTKLTNEHQKIWISIRQEYEKQATAAKTSDERATKLALAEAVGGDSFAENISPKYNARVGVLVGITTELRSLCPTAGGCPAGSTERVVALMQQYREHIASLIAFRDGDMNEKTADPALPDTIRANAIRTQIAGESDARSLIGRAGLQASPEAYAVINAPATQWNERFDLSKAIGRLGDLNVAIKMERRGNFTIKGVSFDPSEVARAISKMGTQLVLSIAQVNGVPVRAANGATPSAGLATSSERLGEAMTAAETSTAEQVDRREALLTIARAITRERAAIEGTDQDSRKAAISATKATFNAHKTRVGTATVPGTP